MIFRLDRYQCPTRGLHRTANAARLGPIPLSGSLAESRADKIHVDSGASKHVYQGINAKEVDPPANDVADPWLGDAK